MRENIILKEQDLFNFVFFRREIDSKKLLFLEESRYIFNLTLFKNIKEGLSENLPVFIKEKIKNRIKCYNPIENIILNPIKEVKHDDAPPADSTEKHAVSKSTFIDESNIYLIRLINYEDSSRLFLFSRNEEKINNYKLIMSPGNETFIVKNNVIPLEIDHKVTVTGIELIFE